MTIIASISNPEQGAFLVGDSMLSNSHRLIREEDVQFPFQGNINDAIADNFTISAAGHAQKLISIRPDVCFAWADLASQAGRMAHFLRSELAGDGPLSRERIDGLTHILWQNGAKVDFILLSCLEDGTYNIGSNVPVWPHDDETIIRVSGSGTQNFVSNLRNLSNGTSIEVAGGVKKLGQALGYCGLAFLDQLTDPTFAGAGAGWGGVMEAAFCTNQGVERVSPIISFFWKAIELEEAKWTLALLPTFIYQYADGESTVSFSVHVPKKKGQLISSSSPFETRNVPIRVPSAFPAQFSLHHVEWESPVRETTHRSVMPDFGGEDRLKIEAAKGAMRCQIGTFWQKLLPSLPPGHEVVRILNWPQYEPEFDWVTPFWRD